MKVERLANIYIIATFLESMLYLFYSWWIAYYRSEGENNDIIRVLSYKRYETLNISIQGSLDDPWHYEIGH
jgi:hypothetical protein